MNLYEAITIAIASISIISNILTWVKNSGKKEGHGDADFCNLNDKFNNLPCIKDPNYMITTGEIRGVVNLLRDEFKSLSDRLDKVIQSLDGQKDKK